MGSPRVVALLVALGLVLAIVPTLAAGFVMCGVSGCSGGGFGVSTDPGTTRVLLLVAGLVAALPLGVYAASRRSGVLGLATLGLALVSTLVAGLVIGSDFSGCPRTMDAAACHDGSR
ncbi:hypothetical protein SAMN04489844_2451 [Nocardioides exalbidus]|uniref:Uncharacterized protein n=1 Tax=Nocardioides exalbidus TaxID=402596 RepID=A0A1H4T6U9_9ACTN|nr:hypothetical protein [Nocardioides exalbidus]SEC52185.1 hypothetical protein SAMN04489844_2451 [Nocardioides exalbidus]